MASEVIAAPEATPTGNEPDTAQETQTAPTPDGANVDVGKDQPKAATLLTADTPKEPVAPVVPESYELKLPEQSVLDPSVTERVTTIAKELGVTDAKHAQRVLDAIHGEVVDALKVHEAALAKGGTAWTENIKRLESEALADKEIGGTPEQLTQSVLQAKAVLDKYATKEFAAFLEDTGLGSHPELIRLTARLAKALGEDKTIQGTPPAPKPKTLAQKLYPSMA